VYPLAYNFCWESVRDRMNRDTGKFELLLEVNLDSGRSDSESGGSAKKTWQKLTPAAQVERLKVTKLIIPKKTLPPYTRFARFFLVQTYQINTNYTKWPSNISKVIKIPTSSIAMPSKI
jgi:hypothetical protein